MKKFFVVVIWIVLVAVLGYRFMSHSIHPPVATVITYPGVNIEGNMPSLDQDAPVVLPRARPAAVAWNISKNPCTIGGKHKAHKAHPKHHPKHHPHPHHGGHHHGGGHGSHHGGHSGGHHHHTPPPHRLC